MKLAHVPSTQELAEAYDVLQLNRRPVTPDEWIRWSQWARLDARLGEILVAAIVRTFRDINPFQLWRANRGAAQPQVLLVILEFASLRARAVLSAAERLEFQAWLRIFPMEIEKGQWQLFMIPPGHPAPRRALESFTHSLAPYLKWGFFGREDLAHARAKDLTLMGKAQRLAILQQILASKKSVSVSDYIAACGGRIHRRTAERDLAELPRLKTKGHTRARRYYR